MKKAITSQRKSKQDRAVKKVLRRAFDFASRPTALLVYDIPLTDEDRAHLALLAQQYDR